MDDVRLPELQVIRRYSIALRKEYAPADEVIAALRADLEKIGGRAPKTPTERPKADERPRPTPAPAVEPAASKPTTPGSKQARTQPARTQPARTTPAARTASRKTKPAKKAARTTTKKPARAKTKKPARGVTKKKQTRRR